MKALRSVTKPVPDDSPARRRFAPLQGLRNNFLTGIVVIAPIGLTVWLIWTVVGWVDGFVLPFVPNAYHPETLARRWFGEETRIDVRGVGVILFLLFTIVVGWLAKGMIGRSFIRSGESIVARMPVVRSIYNGVKQIAETVFAQTETSFDTACLVEYPRKGLWAVGFISTTTRGEVLKKTGGGRPMLSVFLPTTPNPTSGFLLFVPAEDVIRLDMTIEDAAKLVISAGLVYPGSREDLPPPFEPEEAERIAR